MRDYTTLRYLIMVSPTPGVPIRFSQVSSEVLVILFDVRMDLLFLMRQVELVCSILMKRPGETVSLY